jgi:2-oxo-4-hydroxy-4-carboxy-5-ureidoimidazoline decarboxylase
MPMLGLDDLNTIPPDDFVAALDGVFEHAPWVAETAASKRPFASVTGLHDALMAAVRAAAPDVCLGFLRGHSPLSPKALADPGLTEASRAEQSGLGMTSLGDRLAAFEANSAAYGALRLPVHRLRPPPDPVVCAAWPGTPPRPYT